MNCSVFDRRRALAVMSATTAACFGPRIAAAGDLSLQLSTFQVDVTPPLGHPLIAGWRPPAQSIESPLYARGLVIWGAGQPVVLCAVDWCELRNDAYDHWRDAIATAVGTERRRVLVHCVHQHDAPYADLHAQHLLDTNGLPGAMFDVGFHRQVVQRVAEAAGKSFTQRHRVTHYGHGQADVQQVASSRRVQIDGEVSFRRGSFTGDTRVRNAPVGQIDPSMRTLAFYNGDQPLAVLNAYATHPMSYYGRGDVSSDFVGMARTWRQQQTPDVMQIYLSGCSGDVTASKFNDGTDASRRQLAKRLQQGMLDAWENVQCKPIQNFEFRCEELILPPRSAGDTDPQIATELLADSQVSSRRRIQAALTLSWQRRCSSGQPIDVPLIDLGDAQFLLMPAESFVGYQLAAQQIDSAKFLITAGYGECAPGYLPTTQAEREGFVEEHGYAWAANGCEPVIMDAVRRVRAA